MALLRFTVATKWIPEHFPAFSGLFPEYQKFPVIKKLIVFIEWLPKTFFNYIAIAQSVHLSSSEFTVPKSDIIIRYPEKLKRTFMPFHSRGVW